MSCLNRHQSAPFPQVLHDLTLWIPAGTTFYIKPVGESVSVKIMFEIAAGLAVGVTWLVCRHEDWAWILQVRTRCRFWRGCLG